MRKNPVLNIILLTVLSVFILVSCSQDVNPPDSIEVSNTFGQAFKEGATITVSATYKSDYFKTDSSQFNKDLAMLSFVGASAMKGQDCQSFYDTIGFTYSMAFGWDTEPTADSVAYTVASKKTADFEIVGVTVRGFNYSSEWANNVTIGATGDHEGFSLEAEKILAFLTGYIEFFISDPENVKIWIMGYSRGGGISGLLAHKVLSSGLATEKNLYAYTFEAPASLGSADTYNCIHNVRNSADLIPYIPFADWGFYHAGVETDIYSENIRTYLMEDLGLDEDAFPEFDASEYSTPKDFITDYLVKGIMDIDMFSSRAKFFDKVQTPVSEFLAMIMADKQKGMSVVMDYFSDQENIFSFLAGIIDSYSYAYDTFEPLFTDADVDFDDQQLKDVSSFIHDFITAGNAATLIVGIYMNYYYNAMYVIYSHYPEVTYTALKHFSL